MAKLANVRTKLHDLVHGAEAEPIAEGVWIVRGGRPRYMNVYLIEDEGGLTMFDAGISDMTNALSAITARLGGLKRVVLGHGDSDHRGAAPGMNVPVYCHPAEREATEAQTSFRPYWDFSKLVGYARPVYPKLLTRWDGGAVPIEGTVDEGDEVAGFRVVHAPGHARGEVIYFRESDRVAICGDVIRNMSYATGLPGIKEPPEIFTYDPAENRRSIRRLAELEPSLILPGHGPAVTDIAAFERFVAALPSS
jgi:glyoxylase-like metal-dependent hydrolase (beta-lactamase superfamily II)